MQHARLEFSQKCSPHSSVYMMQIIVPRVSIFQLDPNLTRYDSKKDPVRTAMRGLP